MKVLNFNTVFFKFTGKVKITNLLLVTMVIKIAYNMWTLYHVSKSHNGIAPVSLCIIS